MAVLIQTSIRWLPDPQVPFQYQPDNEVDSIRLQLNEFPEEPLYSLLIDDVEVGYFDDLPIGWVIAR